MTVHHSLSRDKRHKIAQIKQALGQSDGPMHRYMSNLDALDRATKQNPTRDVRGQQIRTLDKIHDELLRAVRRLGALKTGLHAQEDLRQALTDSAAAYAAWSFALRSRSLSEMASAQARMKRHFDAAGAHGERGASHLEQGI